MRVLGTDTLKVGDRVGYPLFHQDGTLLLLPYQEVDELLIEALAGSGIDKVVVVEDKDDLKKLRGNVSLHEIATADLEPGARIESTIYDGDGRMLLSAGQEILPAHLAAFGRRGIERVYERHGDYGKKLARFGQVFTRGLAERVDLKVQQAQKLLRVRRSGDPILSDWGSPTPSQRTRANLDDAYDFHTHALERTYGLFERLRVEGSVDLAAAHDLSLTLIDAIARDRDLAISLGGLNLHNDYLIDHSLSVCVLAIAIGGRMGYGKGELLNLGISSLLHDIGMTRVPREVLDKPGELTAEERREIERHPAHGMRLVQRSVGTGAHVPFSIYQTHERMSGGGYPKRRLSAEIHDFAKIIAVADVFQAMTSPRSYKAPLKPYKAMEQILRMVRSQLLDPEAVRAFLQVQSLFPIGSWVKLSKGHVARVVSAADEDFTKPRVSVVLDADGKPLQTPIFLDLSKCDDIKIDDALMADEVPLDFRAGLSAEASSDKSPIDLDIEEESPAPGESEKKRVPMDIMDWSASFAGTLADFRVLEIAQLLDLSQKSGVLRIVSDSAQGEVYLSGGEMRSAEFHDSDGDHTGEEAIFKLIELKEGSFSFSQKHIERERNVTSNNTSILMEGCRRIDEGGEAKGE